MLKAILFDLGDTLFDFKPMSNRTVFDAAGRATYQHLESLGHRVPPLRSYLRMHGLSMCRAYLWSHVTRRDFSMFTLLAGLCKKMRLELDDAGLRDLAWRWYEPVLDYCSVADDVIPTLTKLRDRGYKLAIVSNTVVPGFVLDRHMELHKLLEFFPARIYSSDVGYRKPHPRIFETALGRVGASAAESLFVGDLVKKDIVGARGVGMRTVWRPRAATATSHPLADHVIRRLSDLHEVIPALAQSPPSSVPNADKLICEA